MAKGGYRKEKKKQNEKNKLMYEIRDMIYAQFMSKCILKGSYSI